jgi:PAS domain S-box-containing protein
MPGTDPELQPRPSGYRLDGSSITILVCLVVGLGITAFAYRHFIDVDHQRLHERLLRGTQTLAAYSSVSQPAPSFGQTMTALLALQQAVLDGSPLTQELLDAHTWSPQEPSVETTNLRYMPKVELQRASGEFLMQDSSGAWSAFPHIITDSHQEGVRPVSMRGEYFPILLEAAPGLAPGFSILGLNHFHDDQFHVTMDQARDGGVITTRTSFPLVTNVEPNIISHAYIALYTPGPLPTSIAERRTRHTGFISAATFVPAQGFIDFLPQSYLGLEASFIPHTDAWSTVYMDDESGAVLASEKFAYEEFTVDNQRTHILARPSWTLETTLVTNERWWALCIGLLLTTWVCSLLYFFRLRSRNLARQVETSTENLAERSRRLVEMNSALGESEQRYRMLADNVSDVIFTHDAEGICTYISPSITHHNGSHAADYLGQVIYRNFTQVSIGLYRATIAAMNASIAAGTTPAPRTLELQTAALSGGTKTIECKVSVMSGKDGKPAGYMGVARDISERKLNEAEKAALEAAFQQSQKMEAIGTLAGGVAHDFNNLLTGILGHAELLKEGKESLQEATHSVAIIETAALRARELTSQLLGFARKGHYQSVDVNLQQLLHETKNLLKRTISKNINITCDCPESALHVRGDPGQLSQVILNLAVNARDAMPQGGTLGFRLGVVDLDDTKILSAQDALPAGRYCAITVSDTGIGITPENLPHIFEPFFSDKPKGKGTGLGLAMVYGVTRSHGGSVTVSSEKDQGSVFTVYLPLATPEPAADVIAEDRVMAKGQGHVLVIDDEELIRDLAKLMLAKLGYSVELASGGEHGLELFRRHHKRFDLVIVDMNMPNMDGMACVERLVAIDPEVRIVLSTGYSQQDLGDLLHSSNIMGFLQKPYLLQELSQLLASLEAA